MIPEGVAKRSSGEGPYDWLCVKSTRNELRISCRAKDFLFYFLDWHLGTARFRVFGIELWFQFPYIHF